MKFLVLLLFIVFSGVAQTSEGSLTEAINNLINQTLSWKRISRNDFTPAEKDIIGQFTRDSSNAFCLDYRIDGDYLEDFHLLDLDADKDLDVVYEGFECAGLSTKRVLIYLNKNGRYEKVLYASGRVAALHPGSQLLLYQYPCCSMTENTLVRYNIRQDSLAEDAGLVFFFSPVLRSLSKDYDLILPKPLKAGNRYTVKAGSGIYYVPGDSLKPSVFMKENLAGSVNSDTEVTAYSMTRDNKGHEWLYCNVPQQLIALKNNKTLTYPLMIWIRKKDCILLNH